MNNKSELVNFIEYKIHEVDNLIKKLDAQDEIMRKLDARLEVTASSQKRELLVGFLNTLSDISSKIKKISSKKKVLLTESK